MSQLVDDRVTWVCVGDPPAARLQLADPPSRQTMVDGAWWPASRDPVVELCALVAALAVRQGVQVERMMLQPAAWDRHPRRIGVGGTVVRVGWFATLDAALVIATGPDGRRTDLRVIAPHTPSASAMAAMEMASRPADTTRAAAPSRAVRQLTSDGGGLASWEAEGGHLQTQRPPTTPIRA